MCVKLKANLTIMTTFLKKKQAKSVSHTHTHSLNGQSTIVVTK